MLFVMVIMWQVLLANVFHSVSILKLAKSQF
jgi:hypothetical protein